MKKIVLFLTTFASLFVRAEGTHFISGAHVDKKPIEQTLGDEESAKATHLFTGNVSKKTPKEYKDVDTKNEAFLDMARKPRVPKDKGDGRENIQTGGHLSGKNTRDYKEISAYDRLGEVTPLTMESVQFALYYDSFDYKGGNNNFKPIFREGGSKTPLLFMFSNYYFLWKGFGHLSLGGGIGFGFNQGKGRFATGARSDAKITLWTFPVDLGLKYQIVVWRLLKLGVAGGVSAVGLSQNRSDKDYLDKKKELRQIGYGTFTEGEILFDLNLLARETGLRLLREYQVGRFLLSFKARMHRYSHFKEKDLEISGTSYGIGLTYEYL